MSPLIYAALIILLEGLTFAMVLPVLPNYTVQLGGSVGLAGLMFALLTLPKVVMNPIWGGLSERRGRRPAMALITLGTLSGSVLWALSPRLGGVMMPALGWLILSRGVAGVFSAQAALGYAIASDVSTPQKRTASLGLLGAAFGLAFAIGPAVGGSVAKAWSAESVGWVCAGCQGISLMLIAFGLRETRPTRHDDHSTPRPIRSLDLLRQPPVRLLLVVTMVMTAAYAVLMPTFQPIVDEWYRWDVHQAGWALSLFGLVSVIVQGGLVRPLSRRFDNRALGTAGLALTCAGLLWIAVHPVALMFIAAMILLAVGVSLAVPAITSILSQQVGPDAQGAGHGLNQSATSIGRAVGFMTSGWLFVLGAAWPYWLGACLALTSLLLLLTGRRTSAPSRNVNTPGE